MNNDLLKILGEMWKFRSAGGSTPSKPTGVWIRFDDAVWIVSYNFGSKFCVRTKALNVKGENIEFSNIQEAPEYGETL